MTESTRSADGGDVSSERSLSLTTAGVTLLGVLLGIGVTVGFGVSASLGVRIAAGIGTTIGLIGVVKLATSSGRGPLSLLANWVIGVSSDRS